MYMTTIQEKMLKMKVGSKLHTRRGFIVRTTPTQWRVVRKITNLSRPRWVATLTNIDGQFINV
jgi:hypothetical protein